MIAAKRCDVLAVRREADLLHFAKMPHAHRAKTPQGPIGQRLMSIFPRRLTETARALRNGERHRPQQNATPKSHQPSPSRLEDWIGNVAKQASRHWLPRPADVQWGSVLGGMALHARNYWR